MEKCVLPWPYIQQSEEGRLESVGYPMKSCDQRPAAYLFYPASLALSAGSVICGLLLTGG